MALSPGKHTINWFTPPCPKGCVQSKMISALKNWWLFHPFADPLGTYHTIRYLQRTLSTRHWGDFGSGNGPFDWADSQSVTLDRVNGWPQWTGSTSYPRDTFQGVGPLLPELAPYTTVSVTPTEIVLEYHRSGDNFDDNFKLVLTNGSPYTKDQLRDDIKELLAYGDFRDVPWAKTMDLAWNDWYANGEVPFWPKMQGPGVGDDVWFPSADQGRAFAPRPAPVVVKSFRDVAAPVAGSAFSYEPSIWSKNKSLSNATGSHCLHTDIYDVENGAHREDCSTVVCSCQSPLLIPSPDYDLATTTALQGFQAGSNGCPCVIL